jgi:hypothetical protein
MEVGMARRKDPASEVIEFFQTVSPETAQTVLNICKGIVAKRQPARASKPRVVKPPAEREAVS